MSRCFPYVVKRNGVPGEALIESIKIQHGNEKSKKERSKEKREKKRNGQQGTKSLGGEKCNESSYLLKGKEVEVEPLEKSDVTEEHEHPMDSSCYLSDSTRNSNKRKRHNPLSTPSNNSSPSSCSQTNGNILRFRLPSPKIREPEQCSTSGRVAQQNVLNQDMPFNNSGTCIDIKKVASKSEDKIHHSTTREDRKSAQAETKPHKDERRWAKLCSKMDAFVPLAPQMEQNDCDDEWLLEAKPTKRCRAENDGMLCNRSAALTLWPSAHYLPMADIHALPYTVPF